MAGVRGNGYVGLATQHKLMQLRMGDNPKYTYAVLEPIVPTDMMIFVMIQEEGTEGGDAGWLG